VRLAALYDIHGNLPALEAVLAEVAAESVDLILVGGDVAAGPMPVETIQRLAELGPHTRFVRGNADRYMVEAFDRGPGTGDQLGDWPAARLEPVHRDFLAGFEPTVELEVDALGPTLFCHATPASDEPILTAATPDEVVEAALAHAGAALVVAGHTHMQFDRRVGHRRLVNAGSVGMPYADRPGAYWALLGPSVSLRRTDFDLESAAAAVRSTNFPGRDKFAEAILRPPTAQQAIAAFERQAGRT
jgi:predicted phosphodiesterase